MSAPGACLRLNSPSVLCWSVSKSSSVNATGVPALGKVRLRWFRSRSGGVLAHPISGHAAMLVIRHAAVLLLLLLLLLFGAADTTVALTTNARPMTATFHIFNIAVPSAAPKVWPKAQSWAI